LRCDRNTGLSCDFGRLLGWHQSNSRAEADACGFAIGRAHDPGGAGGAGKSPQIHPGAERADPETGYLVFLNLSQSAKLSKDDEGYVGAISFFGMPRSAVQPSRMLSFEVSPHLASLQELGRLSAPISVTFVPTGVPVEGSRASVAKIDLYEN
jgi:hypothetical protein